jgi:hypothetical protein
VEGPEGESEGAEVEVKGPEGVEKDGEGAEVHARAVNKRHTRGLRMREGTGIGP